MVCEMWSQSDSAFISMANRPPLSMPPYRGSTCLGQVYRRRASRAAPTPCFAAPHHTCRMLSRTEGCHSRTDSEYWKFGFEPTTSVASSQRMTIRSLSISTNGQPFRCVSSSRRAFADLRTTIGGLVLAGLLANGEIANQIHETLGEVLPGEPTISLLGRNSVDPRIRVLLDGAELTLQHLSDGTLQWLQLLTILKNPYRASLIALDEPELGLHPDCISALGNPLCDVAEDPRVQLVVATHSARLLDVFEARGRSDGMRVFENDSGGVRITTPSAAQLAIWCVALNFAQTRGVSRTFGFRISAGLQRDDRAAD